MVTRLWERKEGLTQSRGQWIIPAQRCSRTHTQGVQETPFLLPLHDSSRLPSHLPSTAKPKSRPGGGGGREFWSAHSQKRHRDAETCPGSYRMNFYSLRLPWESVSKTMKIKSLAVSQLSFQPADYVMQFLAHWCEVRHRAANADFLLTWIPTHKVTVQFK